MKFRIIPAALQHVPRPISIRQEELARMLDAAGNLRRQKPTR